MPNALAYLVFWGWPLLIVALFFRSRLPVALAVAIVGAYLFMPHKIAYKIPMVPVFDKTTIPAIAALLMCLLLQNRRRGEAPPWRSAGWLPRSPAALVLLGLYVLAPIPTVLTNADTLVYGERVLPALRMYDAGSFIYGQIIQILPFLLARRYLGDEASQELVLKVFVAFGLAYSLFIVFEARFSPMINETIYGYRQFNWRQQLRDGGFRPVVFLRHGLWTAIFTAMATVAAAALWRAWNGPNRGLVLAATGWLAVTLLVSKSFGALLIALLLAPVAMFLSDRTRLLVAAIIAATMALYPMVRTADYVPTERIVSFLQGLGPGYRAGSLEYRFDNEDLLLEHANERPVFGWGGWARNRVFDNTGEDISTTDGRWIIVFGTYGWVGYIGEYGLLALPILLLYRRRRNIGSLRASIGLALVCVANLIDLVPNATLTPLTWLLAGSVLGRVEQATANVRDDIAARRRRPSGVSTMRAENATWAAERQTGGMRRTQ